MIKVKKGTTGKIIEFLIINFEMAILLFALVFVILMYFEHQIIAFLFIPVIIIALMISYGLEETDKSGPT